MYHNHIPVNERQKYLDLLTAAERLLPTLLARPEYLPTIRKAASAVRGSDELLARVKPPITPAHIVILSDLLKKSRTYVNNFWSAPSPTPSSTPKPSPVPSVAEPRQQVKVSSQPSALSPQPSALRLQPSAFSPQPSQLSTEQTLSQYVHTLSPKLQSQAATLHTKYMELNDKHETLDRLVRSIIDSPSFLSAVQNGSPALTAKNSKEIAYYANCIDRLVHTIDAFWLRVHAERQALAGKPVTKEYQDFLNEEEMKYPMDEKPRNWGDYTKAEIEQMQLNPDLLPKSADGTPVTITQLIQTRQERDNNIIRRRIPQSITEERKQERILAMTELHEWGFLIQLKQYENLQAMGIEVPKDWCNPTIFMTQEEIIEQRKEKDRKRKREQAPLEVKMKIKSKARAARAADNPYKQ